MPKTTEKLTFKGLLGDRGKKAFNRAKEKPVDYGNIGLPAGVNGVAQLAEIKIDKYKTGDHVGKPYLSAMGVVKLPEEHKGAQTRLSPIPLCDTPNRKTKKKLDDHMEVVKDEIGKLLVPNGEEFPEDIDFDDLDGLIEQLMEDAPYFRFSTWKGQKQKAGPYKDREPQVNHKWEGLVDFDEVGEEVTEDDSEEEVADDEDEEEDGPGNGRAKTKKALPSKKKKKEGGKVVPTKKKSVKETYKEAEEEEEDEDEGEDEAEEEEEEDEDGEEAAEEKFDEFGDVDSVLAKAKKKDKEAQKKLTEMALEAGITKKQIENAEDWQEVYDLYVEATGGTGGDEEEEGEDAEDDEDRSEEDVIPKKGLVRWYRPVTKSKKTGKMVTAKDPIECEIVKVYAKKKTVDLLSLDDGSTNYNGVPFAKLEGKPGEDEE